MAVYIDKAKFVGEVLTSSESQLKFREMTGQQAYFEFLRMVNDTPAADVEPVRHGRWVPISESEITGWNPEFAGRDPVGDYQCSVCRKEAIFDCNDEFVLSRYCPHCGATMDAD